MDRLGRGSDFQNWLHLRDLQYSRRGSVPWVERSYDQLFQHFVTRPVKQTALGLSGATAAGALSYASMLYAPKVPKRQSHRLRDADADSVIVSQASRYRGHYRLAVMGAFCSRMNLMFPVISLLPLPFMKALTGTILMRIWVTFVCLSNPYLTLFLLFLLRDHRSRLPCGDRMVLIMFRLHDLLSPFC